MTLDETLDMYWAAAYAEGQRGATREGGLAKTALNAVYSCVRLAIQAAVAAEREACARLAEQTYEGGCPYSDDGDGFKFTGKESAAAIRERSAT